MKMVDDFEDIDNNIPKVKNNGEQLSSDEKMLALMQKMNSSIAQGNLSEVQKLQQNSGGAKFLNLKPEDNSNYWEIKTLPTKYRLYPEGTVISARPLKVLEVKKLTSLNEYNADSIINDILRKCVRGIDINDIYIGDKLYILYWLRANSFRDNNYVVDFDCPHCAKQSNYHFDINCVNINPIDDTYSENDSIKLSNNDGLTIRFLRIKDEIGMVSFKERYTQLFSDSGDEIDDELLALSFMISSINGREFEPIAKYNYLLDMMPEDYSTLSTYIFDNSIGIKQYMTVKCSKCGGESQIGITFRPDFFLPKSITK